MLINVMYFGKLKRRKRVKKAKNGNNDNNKYPLIGCATSGRVGRLRRQRANAGPLLLRGMVLIDFSTTVSTTNTNVAARQ
jgi:hypothetical protein